MAFVLLSTLSFQAYAHVSSVSAATASSGRASVESLDVPFLNPAAIAYQEGYFFGTGGSRFRSDTLGDVDVLSVSLTDNMRETPVPTTLGFSQTKYQVGKSPYERKDIRLAVGNFVYGRNALGGGIAYRATRADQVNAQQFNLFFGGMIAIGRNFSVGAVIENPVPAARDIPPTELLGYSTALAMSYNYKTFMRLKLDIISDSEKPTIAAGLENYFNRWIIVRFGYSKNFNLNHNTAAAGVGFQGPRFGIHYAFQNVQSLAGWDPRHSIDLGVPLW